MLSIKMECFENKEQFHFLEMIAGKQIKKKFDRDLVEDKIK